jgi:anti-sigma regulatory factor (Ser/Thr protein kinase)
MVQLLNHIKLPAKIENLKRWTQSVLECARAQKFEGKRIQEIELALEEALVNICHYSYPEKPGEVEINCKLDGRHFIIEIIDSGIPFDITSLSEPDRTADVDERKIGGLGVFLIKRMMDEVRYRRENDRNILNLIIKMEKG